MFSPGKPCQGLDLETLQKHISTENLVISARSNVAVFKLPGYGPCTRKTKNKM